MDITLVGPGRAGIAVALAAREAGHTISGVQGRSAAATEAAATLIGAAPLPPGQPLGGGDLLIVAVRDDQIEDVAETLVTEVMGFGAAIHLSGLASVGTLTVLADVGLRIGSFHPLQTLPTPEAGAARLPGAWIGVTAAEPLRNDLYTLATSLGAHPFDLPDEAKPLYHAAAAAAANFPLATLAMANDLFEAAGVPFAAARPLVEAVVANAFELGPRAALTGPVARGDRNTVAAQLRAVRDQTPDWLGPFEVFVEVLAGLVGSRTDFRELIVAIEEEPSR